MKNHLKTKINESSKKLLWIYYLKEFSLDEQVFVETHRYCIVFRSTVSNVQRHILDSPTKSMFPKNELLAIHCKIRRTYLTSSSNSFSVRGFTIIFILLMIEQENTKTVSNKTMKNIVCINFRVASFHLIHSSCANSPFANRHRPSPIRQSPPPNANEPIASRHFANQFKIPKWISLYCDDRLVQIVVNSLFILNIGVKS